MRSSASVAVEEAALVVGTAAAGGVAPRILLAAAGLDRARLEEPRLPQPAFDGLLQQAVRPSGDAAFGLHAAELTADGHRLPAPLRYGLAACATVGDQLAMAARYARLLHSDAEAALAVHGDLARVTYRLPASAALVRRHMGERWLGALLLLARREAGDGLAPREVAFAHLAPRDTSAHVHLFRAPLRFEQATDALVLGREVLDVRVRHGDAGLQRVLDGHLSTLLPAVRAAGLPELVQGRLRAAVPGRLPELEAVAAALTITPRTLQRRLAQEGTGFRELVGRVREDLARQHLTESALSVSEIAFVLGFSDASAFNRAFKRWTSATPLAYRRRGARPVGESGASGQDSDAGGQDLRPPPA